MNNCSLIFLLLPLFLFSCLHEENIDGWWIVLPKGQLDDTPDFIWTNTEGVLVYLSEGVLEVPEGIRTPYKFYGHHLAYYLKDKHFFLFSPIDNTWSCFNLAKSQRGYRLVGHMGLEYEMMPAQAIQSYVYPSINSISLKIINDSLAVERQIVDHLYYFFDFASDIVEICTYFKEGYCCDVAQEAKLDYAVKQYIFVQVARLEPSLPRKYPQKVSDTPYIELNINFVGDSTMHFEIGDPFTIPQNLKYLVSFLSNYDQFSPSLLVNCDCSIDN